METPCIIKYIDRQNKVLPCFLLMRFSLIVSVFSLVILNAEERRNSIFQAAAFSFAISPSQTPTVAVTAAAAASAAAAAASAAAAAASAATAASRGYPTTSLQPQERQFSFINIQRQKPLGYLSSRLGYVWSSVFPKCESVPEPGIFYAGMRDGFSTKKSTLLWRIKEEERSPPFFALLTPETQQTTKPDKLSPAFYTEGNEERNLQQEEVTSYPQANRRRDYSWGTRKSSYSRVRLVQGCGRVSINGRDAVEYLQDNPWWLHNCIAPLMELNIQRQYDVIAEVHGGGLGGQSGAIMLAVAREIVRQDPEKRQPLRRAGFLTVDSRRVERKKFGLRKARKREQYSKR